MRIRCLSVIPFQILSQTCELNPTLKYKTYLCQVYYNINIAEVKLNKFPMTNDEYKFSVNAYQKPIKISTGHQQGIISRVYSINKGLSRKNYLSHLVL